MPGTESRPQSHPVNRQPTYFGIPLPVCHPLKVFAEVACPMVKPPVGIEVCPVVCADLLNGVFINSMLPQYFFLGFFPDKPFPVLTSVVVCHSFFLQSEFLKCKNPDWKGGERHPTAETALRHNLIKNDKKTQRLCDLYSYRKYIFC